MGDGTKEITAENTSVIFGHRNCQTNEAKWMCLDNIYQKFHRPNFYDIGGTCIQDVADYWFMYKTEQVGNLFLLHVFINNRQQGSFSVGLSFNSNLEIDKRNNTAYLSKSLKKFQFHKPKEMSQLYLTTYHFSDLDVDFLQNKTLHIAVSFYINEDKDLKRELIENVKINHDFGALLDDPIGSDFTIESADNEKFKVHKVLLAAHSEVFKAMLKEDTAESQNSYVKLVDVSSEDLKCILEFIYTGTLRDVINCNFFNLLMLADQYNLIGLREVSQYALSQQLNIDNAAEVLLVADMYNSDLLKSEALKYIKKNPAVLETNSFKEINNPQLLRELCEYIVPLH